MWEISKLLAKPPLFTILLSTENVVSLPTYIFKDISKVNNLGNYSATPL